MQIAKDARFVIRWTCQVCGNVNYAVDSVSTRANEDREAFAKEIGVDPSTLALIPEVIHCHKCEEAHKMPDDFGGCIDNEEEGEDWKR